MRINLLPREERPLKQTEVRWEFIAGLIATLLFLSVIGVTIGATVYGNRLEAITVEAQARQAILRRQVQDVNAIQARISSYEQQESVYKELLAEEGTSFKDFPRITAHGYSQLWIESILWEPHKAKIFGYTTQKTNLSQYLNQIYEYSDEVELLNVSEESGTDFHLFEIEVKGVGNCGSTTDN